MGDDVGLGTGYSSEEASQTGASRVRRSRRHSPKLGLDLNGFLPKREDTKRSRSSSTSINGNNGSETRPRLAGASRWEVIMGIDMPLLLAVSTLIVFGLLMVNSASWAVSIYQYNSANAYFWRQALWTALGVAGAVVLAFFNYRRFQKLALLLMAATVISLLGVLLFGVELFNATRTLAGGSIQPSELAKFTIIIYLAVWLFARRDQLTDLSLGLIPMGVILGVVGGLIAAQPDLSAVITVFILGGLLFFLAGGELRQISIVILLGAVVGFFIVQSNIFPSGKIRIAEFLAGWRDPTAASDHVRHALEAFVRGGWFGVGIGKGDWKLTLLPVPHTDSVFAVVGEETGFVGVIFLVALFAVVLWRGMSISRRAPDQLGSFLAAGLTIWITLEAFLNMAVLFGLLPFTGNALPLISAGGSSRVMTLAAVGILMNISRMSEETKGVKERSLSAVVDLRGRNRGRSVSSPRRPTRSISQD
ncbi:MAG: cell division protein FtsW [Chloroflexi bacterium]|nr:MAG: cell division protein FtsW [Chloroflexota bacterium]